MVGQEAVQEGARGGEGVGGREAAGRRPRTPDVLCGGERRRGETERDRTFVKIIEIRGGFANVCQRGVMSALDAHVAHSGPQMEQLTQLRDPDGRLESLGT